MLVALDIPVRSSVSARRYRSLAGGIQYNTALPMNGRTQANQRTPCSPLTPALSHPMGEGRGEGPLNQAFGSVVVLVVVLVLESSAIKRGRETRTTTSTNWLRELKSMAVGLG